MRDRPGTILAAAGLAKVAASGQAMAPPLKILFATSEAMPFAKTGGLADVAGSLPRSLRALGHDVRLVLPLHRAVRQKLGAGAIADTGLSFDVPLGDRGAVQARIRAAEAPGGVSVLLVECDRYFDREGLYGTAKGDHEDNAERFILFSRVVVELGLLLGAREGRAFDVFHVHDWQTALVPVYLRTLHADRPGAARIGTLLTIHNLAYQGLFWHWDLKLTGLDWSLFTPERLEFYGKLGFLKGGIIYADAINTVSKTYAKEILTAELGYGLDGVLRARQADLHGILNGADYDTWNPETDPHLPARYGPGNLAGKAACKEALQREFDLAVDANAPAIGMVARLDPQKGIDILAGALDEVLALGVQVAILGTGEDRYHRLLSELSEQYRGRLSVKLRFDERIAHEIEAGADMFLMPSRFEPCGQNQLYSLRYGTVPIVRATGGLADTVIDAGAKNGDPNGFTFVEYSSAALAQAVARAVALFGDKRKWRKLVATGMAQDWSWAPSAREYEALYARLVEKRSRPQAAPGGAPPVGGTA